MARPDTSGNRCHWPTIKSLILHIGPLYWTPPIHRQGAEVSILPPTCTDLWRGPVGLTFQAVNTTFIPTYRTCSLTLDLGLRRSFQWLFIIADVKKAILGADFIQHYKLLVIDG